MTKKSIACRIRDDIKMTRNITPKLEELIPVVGFRKYLDRLGEEMKKCYDLDGRLVIDYPRDYTVELLFYNLAAVSSSIVGLTALIDYIAK